MSKHPSVGSTKLAKAIEKAYQRSAFVSPLPQMCGRDKWEALLALLQGRPPALGKLRAADLAYLKKGEAARKLLDEVRESYVRFGGSRKWSFHRNGDPIHEKARLVNISEVFSLLGLMAYDQSPPPSAKEETLETYYSGLVDQFIRMSRMLGPDISATLTRIFGIPHFRLRQSNTIPDDSLFAQVEDYFCKPYRGSDSRWWIVHLSAKRIHSSYIRRFHQSTLQRGASAMVADMLACIREGLIAQTSIACLLQDLGGHIVFLFPDKFFPDGQERTDWLKAAIEKVLKAALSEEGYFASIYPLEWKSALEASDATRRTDLAGWRSRGIFPDLSIRLRETSLQLEKEVPAGPAQSVSEETEICLPGNRDLLASPPAVPARACYGCHVESRAVSSPWWPELEKNCPGCALVVASGQRLSQQALEGMVKIAPRVFERCVPAESSWSLGEQAITVYLDGMAIGARVRDIALLKRPLQSQILENELRARYRQGIEHVARACEPWPKEAVPDFDKRLRVLPVDVLWMGGDDLCVSFPVPRLALPFLQGFFSVNSQIRFAGAALLHSTRSSERARASHALPELLEKAKTRARQTGPPPPDDVRFIDASMLGALRSLDAEVPDEAKVSELHQVVAFTRLRTIEELAAIDVQQGTEPYTLSVPLVQRTGEARC